eukprot:UN08325
MIEHFLSTQSLLLVCRSFFFIKFFGFL